MDLRNALALTHLTWLEIRRARLWWFAVAMLVVCGGIAEFAAALSITETAEHRLVFYAASMRLTAVFVMALFVSSSVLREIDDKGLELALSRPISRGDWFVGKFLGYAIAALGLSALISLPLVLLMPLNGLIWCYSLILELIIVVAAALAFAITLRQITFALSVVAGFYVLSRSIAGILLISHGSTIDLSLVSNQFFASMVELLASVLPDLDRFTQAAWLVGPVPSGSELLQLTMQSLIYGSLLAAVGLFDLHRREF